MSNSTPTPNPTPQPGAEQFVGANAGADGAAALQPSQSNNWLLRVLIVLIVMVLMAISFYLGRTTAPGAALAEAAGSVASSENSGESTAATGESGDSAAGALGKFITETGLIPGKDFSAPESGQVKDILADFTAQAAVEEYSMGSPDAPVTMTLIEDFSCPMCTRFQKESWPSIEKLVKEGKVRVQWNNMVIFAEMGSDWAAKAAIAAGNQGHLWEFVHYAYGSAADGDHPSYTAESVVDLARESGVADMAKFESDLNDAKTAAIVEEQGQRARDLGVGGTPFFIINDAVISGAYPKDYFENTIKYQLFAAENA